MAGIHFIILKVNGVDVSQMTHEEAIQMFLKASEPIIVEVRRRSYNAKNDENNFDIHAADDALLENEPSCSKRQSPTHTHIATTTVVTNKQQELAQDSSTTVDSLKFHGLVISSNLDATDADNPTKNKLNRRSNDSLSFGNTRSEIGNITNSASTSSFHLSKNPVHSTNYSLNEICNQLNNSSISSVTSPTKSINQNTATSSLYREFKFRPEAESEQLSRKSLVSVGTQTDNYTNDLLFNGSAIIGTNHMIENEHNLFSECLAPEIDIEEITLRKSDSNERLGLTVCYSSGGGNESGSDDTDTCTEVFISDIVPDSIAGRDGRLRQGDQILQVNGKDVLNREETETLIAENNNAVTLLISRYLYGDDDEFNEQGDYYDDEEPDMVYGNCFLDKYILNKNISKPVKEDLNEISPKKSLLTSCISKVESNSKNCPVSDVTVPSTDVLQTATSPSTSRDPLNHQNIRAHLEQVTQEIAILDSRVENMMSQHIKPIKNVETNLGKYSKEPISRNVLQVMDYDTEHIYETIPEDSESEPFYCSPYEENSEHHTRIEQWLDMQDKSQEISNETIEHKTHSFQQKLPNFIQNPENINAWPKVKTGTIRSTNSSAGDDHENSSSAYNTGGSCNSNTMTPLTLEFNSNCRDRDQQPTSTLVLCSAKSGSSSFREIHSQEHVPTLSTTPSLANSIKSSHRFLKDKVISPTHSSKFTQMTISKQKPFTLYPKPVADLSKSNNQNTPISVTNTMYTNVANLQQTMLLQQQLFRQSLTHQGLSVNSNMPCPQFTAPNLSQYHFVSSQEVSTVKLNTHSTEDHMVWKVKRRQDGTRYIVRRPARTRLLRNRALRISAERNDQTTEDDTISEIKTGRYWTKEERKKHIERARGRRQRQQIIITNKNNETQQTINYPPAGAQSSVQSKSIEAQQSPLGAANSKVQRQSIPTGQNITKKLVKKSTTNSPLEIAISTSVNGAIKSTATNSSGKMTGILSVTTV